MTKKVCLLVSFLCLVIQSATPTYAAIPEESFKTFEEGVVLAKGETVDGLFFKTGGDITLSGTVNGDVYLVGSNITIDGEINGDLFAAGGVINIKGRVSDDARVLGALTTVSGEVGKNLTAVGGRAELAPQGKVGKSVLVVSAGAYLGGDVGEDAKITAQSASLAGKVGRNSEIGAAAVTLEKTADLKGNLTYYSVNKAAVQSGASIAGKVSRTNPAESVLAQKQAEGTRQAGIKFWLLSYLSWLLVGVVLLKAAGKKADEVINLFPKKAWQSLGVGFLALIFIPLIAIILLVSIVGIPLAVLLLAGFVLTFSLSSLAAGYFVGTAIAEALKTRANPYARLAGGYFLIHLLLAAPLIGMFVRTVNAAALLGTLVILLLNRKS